jgi:hypothetical protein
MNKAAPYIQDQGSKMSELLAPLAVSLMIFFCRFAAAAFGMGLRKKLPDDHFNLTAESRRSSATGGRHGKSAVAARVSRAGGVIE